MRLMNSKKRLQFVFTKHEDADGSCTWPDLQWLINELYSDLHPSEVPDPAGDVDAVDEAISRDDADDDAGDDAADSNDDAGTDADDAADQEPENADDRLKIRIAKLQEPTMHVKWASSRFCFLTKSKHLDKHKYKEWPIPRKARQDLPSLVKWLTTTRRVIKQFETTGVATKVTVETLCATDDELSD